MDGVELLQQLTEVLQAALGSPWLWVAIFVISGLDAVVPFMPSEVTVLTVAVLLGPDLGRLALLVIVATAGAWVGDCLGYMLGRGAGARVMARFLRGPKGRQRFDWARGQIDRQAPLLIIAARYLPGGRVASALATGSTHFPFRRFVWLDVLGAALWALYSVLIGYVGGTAFTGAPVKGLLLSFGIGLALVVLIEFTRRLRMRSHRQGMMNDRAHH